MVVGGQRHAPAALAPGMTGVPILQEAGRAPGPACPRAGVPQGRHVPGPACRHLPRHSANGGTPLLPGELLCAINNNNNNIYLLQLGCYPVAVVILHVNKT